MLIKKTMWMRRLTAAVAAAAVAAAVFSLVGCSTPTGSASDDMASPNDKAAPTDKSGLSGADLNGLVVDFDESGLTLRPDEGDDETAKISLIETGAEQRLEYADGCQFVIAHGNVSTGTVSEEPATAETVKKDASAYVWLDASGLVEKVAVFRTE
ncbi:hypothetical protein C1878_00095 [Gordonibacter sp. 28C]|uniref:hypothetical protein n=1 Tax=Gordonibacter sp. 28C TaxID=2078569 RepID=UPI000DF84ED4|nr:hypothetical protein [Gordonibacter sp. 28C]RDB64307.1 hypothetical protein C1878_00095 [Gordonibacter sp. 28C]